MSRSVKVLVMAFLSVLITIIFLFLAYPKILEMRSAAANPNKCPDDHSCWCGRNKAGKVQLMVDQAVANGWTEVDMSLCVPNEPVKASNTPFQPKITWTPIKRPTNAPVEPTRATTSVFSPSATYLPIPPTKIALTPYFCDSCSLEQIQANALSTIAAVEATRLSREQTREPIP